MDEVVILQDQYNKLREHILTTAIGLLKSFSTLELEEITKKIEECSLVPLKEEEKKFISHTLITHFNDTGRNPSYYDAILTGDLGHVGKEILLELAQTKGFNIKSNYNDCGVLIFDKETQDTHAGGSGCACCATVFSGYLFNMLQTQKYKKILLIATGALMNSTSTQQGESIPGIAHAVSIEK